MTAIFNPGALRHRMVLEEIDDAPDGAGGAVRAWSTVQEFWASLTPVQARFAVNDGSAEQRVTHQLVYRAGPELTVAHRLRLDDRLFSIMSVRDVADDGSIKTASIEEIKS